MVIESLIALDQLNLLYVNSSVFSETVLFRRVTKTLGLALEEVKHTWPRRVLPLVS